MDLVSGFAKGDCRKDGFLGGRGIEMKRILITLRSYRSCRAWILAAPKHYPGGESEQPTMPGKSKKARLDLKLDGNQLNDLRSRLKTNQLEAGDYALILKILELVVHLQVMLEKHRAALLRLLRMIFGVKTERIRPRRGQSGRKDSSGNPCPPTKGRNGRDGYPGARKVCIEHGEYQEGDVCPDCEKGKLRDAEPSVDYAWQGLAPITLTIFLLQRLVCDLCKKTFMAHVPEGHFGKTVDDSADEHKVARCDANASANAMVVLMRFQYGVPNYRLALIQGQSGLPLPEGSQHRMMQQVFVSGVYIYEAMISLGAQGDLFQNDDTRMRILDFLATSRKIAKRGDGTRVSTRTSVVVARTPDGHEIILYFTGSAVAGENLAWILSQRLPGLGPPRLICDGHRQNHPPGHTVIVGNCLGHVRRKFYELNERGP